MKVFKIKQGSKVKAVIERYEDGKIFIAEKGFNRFVAENGFGEYYAVESMNDASYLSDEDFYNILDQMISKFVNSEIEVI